MKESPVSLRGKTVTYLQERGNVIFLTYLQKRENTHTLPETTAVNPTAAFHPDRLNFPRLPSPPSLSAQLEECVVYLQRISPPGTHLTLEAAAV